MYIPKRYGQSRIDNCPFCGQRAIAQNSQGVPVCRDHTKTNLPDLKCVCGGYLDIMKGKYGVFFNCFKCGNMNLKKALEINDLSSLMVPKEEKKEKHEEKSSKQKKFSYMKKPNNSINKKREITIRSDDPMYFD